MNTNELRRILSEQRKKTETEKVMDNVTREFSFLENQDKGEKIIGENSMD